MVEYLIKKELNYLDRKIMTMLLVTIYFVEGISFEIPSTFDGRHSKGHDQRAVDNTNRLRTNKLCCSILSTHFSNVIFPSGMLLRVSNQFETK